MTKVFISYSHKDEALRNELETHLAMLKRDGTIETWHDRRIVAGTDLDDAISENLENAEIVLILVTASFLASNYCYENEMLRALEKQKEGSSTLIPVILRPCDWHSSPFGKLNATPTDGKPVTMFGNQDEAFTIVAKDIRSAAQHFNGQNTIEPAQEIDDNRIRLAHQSIVQPRKERSSNLRVTRKFTDQERDDFIENAYEYISRYFEGSLDELGKRNTQISSKFKRIDATNFIASIYLNGEKVSSCSIAYGNAFGSNNSIRYSNSADNSRNSWNEMLSVNDDGYTLSLQGGFSQSSNKVFTEEGAAEFYWTMLISPLQRMK